MKSKASLSRAVLRGTAVALALGASLASTTLAVGQQVLNSNPAKVAATQVLANQLRVARSKAQVIILLNNAADSGLTKADIQRALMSAMSNNRNPGMRDILFNINNLVLAASQQDGGAGTATFVDNGGATGSTFFVAGNNAASGSVIDTSEIGGGTDFFQQVYAGPYTP